MEQTQALKLLSHCEDLFKPISVPEKQRIETELKHMQADKLSFISLFIYIFKSNFFSEAQKMAISIYFKTYIN